MKKITALLLVMLLVCGTICSINAIGYSYDFTYVAGDAVKAIGASNTPKVDNKDVANDIEVKESTPEAEFVDGPIYMTIKADDAYPVFDFRSTLYMEAVRSAFTGYMTLGKAACERAADAAIQRAADAAVSARVAAEGAPDASTLETWKTQALAAANTYAESIDFKQSYINELYNLKITGSFDLSVTYPNGTVIPDAMLTGTDMYGMNTEYTSKIFAENEERTIVNGDKETTLTMHIAIVGPANEGYVTAKALEDNLAEYLHDFTLTGSGVTVNRAGVYILKGKVTGATVISDATKTVATINYNAVQYQDGDKYISNGSNNMAATVSITKKSSGSSSGKLDSTVSVDFNLGRGVETEIPKVVGSDGKVTVNVDKIGKVERDGYAFDGWYLDEACTIPATGEITLTKNTTLHAKWVKATAPEELEAQTPHMAYIIGYPDGTVRPENNITREEVATIFYRLLKTESREKLYTDKNTFVDVDVDKWSNKAISTMAKGEYVKGYDDNTFRPENAITRAEFVTIISRFNEADSEPTETRFADAKGHWAEKYIEIASENGWVSGYEDGTFRPDQNITRAEAITIINKLLVRYIDEDGLCEGYTEWKDNDENDWYYYQMIEATNSHEFERAEGELNEKWTKLKENQVLSDKEKYEDPEK